MLDAQCRLAQSVVALKFQEKPSGKKADESPIVVRDISNWSAADENLQKRSADIEGEPFTPVDDGSIGSDKAEDPKPDTRVDVGVFFENDRRNKVVYQYPDEFSMKRKMEEEEREERKDFVGHCSWADILVPIEVKIDLQNSAFYFDDNPSKFLRTDDDDQDHEGLGQVGEHVRQIFRHQHRVHLYAVCVFRDRARLLYFERQGALVSEPFTYGTREHLHLHTFFYRLAHMSREQLGLDPTVVPTKAEDVEAMLAYAPNAPTDYIERMIYHTLSWNPTAKKHTSTQWPAYKVTVGGRQYIIARPLFSSPSLFGRCTRGYLAYDVEARTTRFLKDCWRVNHGRMRPEHEVYTRLKNASVENVMRCNEHSS